MIVDAILRSRPLSHRLPGVESYQSNADDIVRRIPYNPSDGILFDECPQCVARSGVTLNWRPLIEHNGMRPTLSEVKLDSHLFGSDLAFDRTVDPTDGRRAQLLFQTIA